MSYLGAFHLTSRAPYQGLGHLGIFNPGWCYCPSVFGGPSLAPTLFGFQEQGPRERSTVSISSRLPGTKSRVFSLGIRLLGTSSIHTMAAPALTMESSRPVNYTVEEPASTSVNPTGTPGNESPETPFATPISATPVAPSLTSRRETYVRTASTYEGALNPHEAALACVEFELTQTSRRAASALQEQPTHWRFREAMAQQVEEGDQLGQHHLLHLRFHRSRSVTTVSLTPLWSPPCPHLCPSIRSVR